MADDAPSEKPPNDPRLEKATVRREHRVHPRISDPFSISRGDIFFAAVETTRMPMIFTDPRQPDNPIIFANNAFITMTGYAREEIVGANCRFLQGPETDPDTIADLRRAIAERRDFATEILNYRKDGYSFWNALFVSPIYDDEGELVYFFASQLDVSRRREAEDGLRQAQKMEALGRLTGGIAHDFNNLLQVMTGYLELIGSGLKKPEINRDKLTRSIENARNAADRAASLTQQLLAFARKQRLEGRVLSLNDLARSMSALGDRTLGDDVAIETDLDDGLLNCRVDPTQVEVALLNILINARDAMVGRPKKRVGLKTRNVVVGPEDMAAHQNLGPGRYASIEVSDTGGGIPRRVIERVMDPFFTTKEEGKGTGLGLSMVYGFAKQSGGSVSVSSEENVGTTISMLFPAVEGEAPPAPRTRGRALDRPGTETILVVEDREDVAALVRMILEDLGYTILRAANGGDALAIVESDEPIDLLFSDLIMPGDMNGVALARKARSLRSGLKVLLTTGYSEASIERTHVGGPEFDVINKPYGRADLARKVRIVLDGPTGVS